MSGGGSMPPVAKSALERLLKIAQSDTGQSRRVADFLLAWWNAGEHGGFDFTNLWSLDDSIVRDCVAVFMYIGSYRVYPDSLGYSGEFDRIIAEWRGGAS